MALTDNIVAYWKLDGSSVDSVGSHIIVDTNITYSAGNGKINSGAGFNGSTSKIFISDNVDWTMGSGDFTISLWIKKSVNGTRQFFLGQCASSGAVSSISFFLEFQAANTILAYVAVGSTLYTVTSSGTITDTNWHHVVFTRSSTTLTLYIDNASVGTGSISGSINDSPYTLALGAGGEFVTLKFPGSIDEVGIWKGKALSPAEISTLYNGGVGLQYPFILPATGNFFLMFN